MCFFHEYVYAYSVIKMGSNRQYDVLFMRKCSAVRSKIQVISSVIKIRGIDVGEKAKSVEWVIFPRSAKLEVLFISK